MGGYTTSELERDTGFGRRTIAYYVQEGLLPRVGRRGPRTRYPELVRDRLLFIRRVREAEAESEIRPVPLRDLRELFKALPPELVASVAGGDTAVTSDIVSLASVEQRSMVNRVAALRKRLLAERPRPTSGSRATRVRESEELVLRSPALPDLDEDWPHDVRTMEELEPRGEALREAEEPHAAQLSSLEEHVAYSPAPPPPASRFDAEVMADAAPPRPGDSDEDADTLGKQLAWVLNELRSQARRRRELAPDAIDTWSQVEVASDIRLSIRGMADEDAFLLRVAGRLLRQVLESHGSRVEQSSSDPEE